MTTTMSFSYRFFNHAWLCTRKHNDTKAINSDFKVQKKTAIFKDYASICLERQFNPLCYNNGKPNDSSNKHNNILISLEISYMYTLWLMIKSSTGCKQESNSKIYNQENPHSKQPMLRIGVEPSES